MSVTRQFADFALSASYADLPAAVRHSAKLLMLDTLGCALGALGTTPGLAVRRIAHQSGSGPATVLGTGHKAPVATAAWANGRLGNVLDMDECYKVQGHHAQAALGAALALGEEGRRSGCDVLMAFTMGFEAGVRLGNFLSPRVTVDDRGRTRGWTGLVGPGQGVHAACAAASRLLGASAGELADAFGMCAQYMVGRDWSRQWGRDPDLGTLKYADTGWNAQGGLMAAWHAREGLRGIRDIFDTDSYAQVFQGVLLDPAALLRDAGSRWYLPETSIKFWPCCRWIHYALTAFDHIVREHGLAADEIGKVELRSFPMIPYPRFGASDDPPNLVAASFSFAHAAAMVALGVPAGPQWFADDSLHGEAARAMRAKVGLGDDERGYDPRAWGLEQGELKVPSHAIVHARGKVFEATGDYALGDSWEGAPRYGQADVIAKFRRLAKTLAPLSDRWEQRIDRMVETVLAVDELDDVRELTAALSLEG
ncbi:MmgE/PrpD family protein [Pigmentiphaga soli]|uniref:MmgE/PrpD family protein n=1 Tax=Pigmentiphaga soli TaxID=1007095 RepID=A0ABP8H1F6_9BURK